MELIIFTSPDAGRSAMAAAFFNALVTPSIACAIAAIPDPELPIDPVVVASFEALNLGRSLRPPCRFTEQLGVWAAEIIHVGSTSASFEIGGVRTLEWDIADPRKHGLEEVSAIRDWIRHCVETHLREKEWLREPDEQFP
jgi:arsenate reductase (thioredoxin)